MLATPLETQQGFAATRCETLKQVICNLDASFKVARLPYAGALGAMDAGALGAMVVSVKSVDSAHSNFNR